MKASDTVMSEREIQSEINYADEAMEFIPIGECAINKAMRVANRQAEITWKTCLKEVVELLNHGGCLDGCRPEWQSKLKEWGLE